MDMFKTIGLLLLITVFVIFSFFYDIGINSKYQLKKAYAKYNSFFEVSACHEAYDLLASSAKKNHSFEEFKKGCEKPNIIAVEDRVIDIVFINKGYARVRVQSTNGRIATEGSISWKKENGKWKRDWPN